MIHGSASENAGNNVPLKDGTTVWVEDWWDRVGGGLVDVRHR